jgi:2-polyprenyl-3-methyl-5-hydroxy-6-metoxy-1,4-benzoquinol methylase
MAKNEEKYFRSNIENWNKKVLIHLDSAFYDVASFRNGKNSLNEIELSGVGDVQDKSMLHLQCHFGLDSMSWSRLGAAVTGVDFSDEAIKQAMKLNSDLGLNARFICSNVYDLKQHLDETFDVVFTSYGVIGWLPDLDRWAAIVSHFLRPGGIFYMAEFHPYIWMYDDDFIRIEYSYFNQGVIEIDQEDTYAEKGREFKHKEYSWNHPISEVINALRGQGLEIERFNEYDYSPYDCFNKTIRNEEGNFYIQGFERKLPMVYSIKAIKPK